MAIKTIKQRSCQKTRAPPRRGTSRKTELAYIPPSTPTMDDDFTYHENVSTQEDRADTPSNGASGTIVKKQRKSAKGRTLMRWSPDVDQFLLLCIDYVCTITPCDVPWDAIGSMMEPKLTTEAIKQHLAKLRKARVNHSLPVPPLVGKVQRRRARQEAEAAVEEVKFQQRSGLLPPISVQSKKRKVNENAALIVKPTLTQQPAATSEAVRTELAPARAPSTKAPNKPRGRKRNADVAFQAPQQVDGSRSIAATPVKKRSRPQAGFYQEVPLTTNTPSEEGPTIDPLLQSGVPYQAQQTQVATAPMFPVDVDDGAAVKDQAKLISQPDMQDDSMHDEFSIDQRPDETMNQQAPVLFDLEDDLAPQYQAFGSHFAHNDEVHPFEAAPYSGLSSQALDTHGHTVFGSDNYFLDNSTSTAMPPPYGLVLGNAPRLMHADNMPTSDSINFNQYPSPMSFNEGADIFADLDTPNVSRERSSYKHSVQNGMSSRQSLDQLDSAQNSEAFNTSDFFNVDQYVEEDDMFPA